MYVLSFSLNDYVIKYQMSNILLKDNILLIIYCDCNGTHVTALSAQVMVSIKFAKLKGKNIYLVVKVIRCVHRIKEHVKLKYKILNIK